MTDEFDPNLAQLFGQVQQGDQSAYGLLLEKVEPMLLGYIRRHVRDTSLWEDVYQNVLLKMHVSRHTFDTSRPFEPWVYSVAKSALNNFYRKEGRYQGTIQLVEELPYDSGEDGGQEVKLAFKQAVEQLTPKQLKALEMTRLQGLSMEEGAKLANTSVSAFKVMAHRAQKALKEELLDLEKDKKEG